MEENMNSTPVSKFGKDHWSMLAYVECRCVDGREGIGILDRSRVRCNPATHPLLTRASLVGSWKLKYSTRLTGYFDFADRDDPEKAIAAGLMIRDHDDWDCLDDLAAAGLVDILSLANGAVKLTPLGVDISAKLRAHKATGGQFAGFVLDELLLAA